MTHNDTDINTLDRERYRFEVRKMIADRNREEDASCTAMAINLARSLAASSARR